MSDPRFARLKTDPRFRPIKKKHNKVVVDDRFKSVLQEGKKKDKSSKGRVDKYGRPLASTHEEDNLKRFYRFEEDKDEDEDVPRRPDYARGELLLESSDEDEAETKHDENDDDSDTGGFVTLGNEDDNVEIDLDENTFADLETQAATYAREHPEDGDEEEQEDIPRTKRLAVVNLDWAHVRAAHLYKIVSSLVSATAPLPSSSSKKEVLNHKRALKEAPQVNIVRGKVLNVVVYPSDFGKERMAKEEKEGPPAEIFKKRKNEDEIDEKSLYDLGGEDEVDEDALRRYQLERLRYYYAIVTCDTVEAASHIYDELQGTELERSANVFDLSFVPDEMTFENTPRDEAAEDGMASSSKGIDFVTDALRHSKVKLTWDEDDPERNQVTRRTLTRQEIEDGDFRAYIASSESESEPDAADVRAKKAKKAGRDKLRALLLGGNDDTMPEGWGDDDKADDVDMEITFTPGLIGKTGDEDETTLEKYQRKLREKRKKRKEEVKEQVGKKGKEKAGPTAVEDDFFEAQSEDGESDRGERAKGKRRTEGGDIGGRTEATAEELALLAASDNPNAEPKHFDFKAVIKAEKKKGKKGKKHKKGKGDAEDELQDDFVMDVQDDRFKVLHEDHQFAIDPSNPHFKKTKGMTALLEERRKRLHSGGHEKAVTSTTRADSDGSKKSLDRLVESVKRKSAQADTRGMGKRRKL